MNVHFNKIISVPESSSFFTAYASYRPDQMITHYNAALDPTNLHMLDSLQSQFSLYDGTPHDQRYRRTEPMQGGDSLADVIILTTQDADIALRSSAIAVTTTRQKAMALTSKDLR